MYSKDITAALDFPSVYSSVDNSTWHLIEGSFDKINYDGGSINFTLPDAVLAHYLRLVYKFNPAVAFNGYIVVYAFSRERNYKFQRSIVQHPSDGRIFHYDIEDFDEDHKYSVVMDRGLLANDAMLKGRKAKIIDNHGSCRHVIELSELEDRLEFFANNIMYRPKSKISILMWIKPSHENSKNSVSPIFVVTGMHPDPLTSYIRLDRFSNGSIKCSHRNESGEFVFLLASEENESRENEWVHIACTYAFSDSDKGEIRLYINGTLKYRGKGNGYLSKDWDGYSALGFDNEGHQFYGNMDEIMVFDRVLEAEEINKVYLECTFDKYYSGGHVWIEKGKILSPMYPELYKGPIRAHWLIHGKKKELIVLNIEEMKIGSIESCDRSNMVIREMISGFLIERICGGIIKPREIVSTTNSVTLDFETSGEPDGIKYAIKFQKKPEDARQRSKILRDQMVCKRDIKIHNSTSVLSVREDNIHLLNDEVYFEECMSLACNELNMTEIYYRDGECYAITPQYSENSIKANIEYSKEKSIGMKNVALPDYESLHSYESNCKFGPDMINSIIVNKYDTYFLPMLDLNSLIDCKNACCVEKSFTCHGVILVDETCYIFSRTSMTQYEFRPAFFHQKRTVLAFEYSYWTNITRSNKYVKKEECPENYWPSYYVPTKNIQLKEDSVQIKFTYLASEVDKKDCQNLCCSLNELCDAALLHNDQCFALQCLDMQNCDLLEHGEGNNTSNSIEVYPTNDYINKYATLVDRGRCEISKVIYKETFRWGLNAGVFTNLGRVSSSQSCPKMVCMLINSASMAFQAGKHCFSVACNSKDSCETKTIEETVDSSSTISTIIWIFTRSQLNENSTSPSNVKKTKLEIVTKNRSSCFAGESFQGVTIDSLELSTSNIKHVIGYDFSMPECVSACCSSQSCDLAFLNGTTCHNFKCENIHSCATKTVNNQFPLTSLTHIVRSLQEEIPELKFSDICKNYSDSILYNQSFSSIPISTLKFLGLVKTIDECTDRCCKRALCDTVYVVGYSCYGLICGEDFDICKVTKNDDIQIPTYIIYNLRVDAKKYRIQRWLQYSVILLLAGSASVIGIAITAHMCIKRQRTRAMYRSYRDSDD